jgi:uncharacterized protein (TIGR03435 family)
MPDAQDMELVRKFARDNSETAFTELVRRHINLVYSVARRCTVNDGDAHDVTQAVFIILARKANSLGDKTNLSGWLYETTRFAAARLLRTNARRHAREQEAYMQSTLNEADNSAIWAQLSPHLETAMGKLNAADRALLVLRFYENKSGPEAAALLGIREDAAHKRVTRAIEKLRKFFAQRGVTLTATAIAGAVSANSVQAAPVALVKTISAVAIAKGAAATTSTLTLVKGALKIMAWTKMKTAIVAGAVVLLAAGTVTVTVPKIRQAYLAHEVIWSLDSKLLQRQPPVVLIRPAQPIPGMIGGGGYIAGSPSTSSKMMGLKLQVLSMLLLAYQDPTYYPAYSEGIHPRRVIVSAKLPQGEYDFIASTPAHPREAMQTVLKKQFGLVAHWEMRDTDVLLLKVKNPEIVNSLKRSETTDGNVTYHTSGKVSIRGGSLSLVASLIENDLLSIPVIDQTGVTNVCDFDLTFILPTRPMLNRALLNQLGLELVPTNMPIEMLVVEKVK